MQESTKKQRRRNWHRRKSILASSFLFVSFSAFFTQCSMSRQKTADSVWNENILNEAEQTFMSSSSVSSFLTLCRCTAIECKLLWYSGETLFTKHILSKSVFFSVEELEMKSNWCALLSLSQTTWHDDYVKSCLKAKIWIFKFPSFHLMHFFHQTDNITSHMMLQTWRMKKMYFIVSRVQSKATRSNCKGCRREARRQKETQEWTNLSSNYRVSLLFHHHLLLKRK